MTDSTKSYQIKHGYICNPVNPAKDNFGTHRDDALSEVSQYYVYQTALKLARQINAKKILDVGSGIGLKLKKFFYREFKVFGVDTKTAVETATRAMPEGVFLDEDLQNPQFGLRRYLSKADVIICADVLEHVEDPDVILHFIKEFANKDTLIVLSTPERESLHGRTNRQPRNPYHVREWSFDEFQRYIRASGFNIIEHRIVFSNQIRPDLATLEWFIGKLLHGMPIKHAQLIVCNCSSD